MSTNKATDNTPVHEHYRSDALIATGATISVLILGGVLQFLSPDQKMAADSDMSQSTAYSETATADTASETEATPTESLAMTTSEETETSSEMTDDMTAATEASSFTSETETAAVAPAEAQPESMMEATAPAITDSGMINQLNGQVYATIDQSWVTNPTFTNNLVYQIKVTEAGAIAAYDSINQSAEDYSSEIPLPTLVASDANSEKMAKFLVVFTPGGQLEVSPWIAN